MHLSSQHLRMRLGTAIVLMPFGRSLIVEQGDNDSGT
ncbi:hypothetical protein Rleg5DRAFT_0335 [Rhizobium leguminosarum bv. viciae WSM1455]|nr:hypothetical protein Rleg5DRAFT_0335 [Rhizobium leguminosarum bv. viciae WSM1455]